MTDKWNERVDDFWAGADDSRPDAMLTQMKALRDERPADDPAALFEQASVYDFLGRETDAIPLYRQAIAAGLDGDRLPQALIQLASSLRNTGKPEAAIEIIAGMESSIVAGDAHQAFLALSLFDAGRPGDALAVALRALAKTLPLYGRAVSAYASELETGEQLRD